VVRLKPVAVDTVSGMSPGDPRYLMYVSVRKGQYTQGLANQHVICVTVPKREPHPYVCGIGETNHDRPRVGAHELLAAVQL